MGTTSTGTQRHSNAPTFEHANAPARRLTPVERLFTRSPFSIVTMVARIRGDVGEGRLAEALDKVRLRHPNLRARIVEDGEGEPWLTSEGAGPIPVEALPRESDEGWIPVVQEACRAPFDFQARPAVRLILVRGPDVSELAIVCHHILCDGLSLAFLARDLLLHLGDPGRPVQPLPDPLPIGGDNLPAGVSANPLVRWVIGRMNRKWAAERVVLDDEDYRCLGEAYWRRYPHQLLPVELSAAQTAALVDRCRREGVTVNSALCAAFVGAQVLVQGEQPFHASLGVAASLRERLPHPPGEAMGFYAGLAQPTFRYDPGRGLWDNARRLQGRVRPLFTDKKLFADLLLWSHLDPTILEAINFKKLGGLVPEGASRYDKLAAFAARADTVLAILERDRLESLDRIAMGTAVTNLGRLDFPARYGPLELERLIMKPGGAFPLANVNLVLGAVTCAGRLSLALEFVEDNLDAATAQQIAAAALQHLLQE